MTDQQEPTLSERLRDLGPDNSGFRKIGLEAAATIDRLTAALAEATKPDHALHPLSEIREWDEALSELGIQDSVRTPTEAIRELKARIEELDAGVSDIKRATIEGRVCDDIA